MNTTFDQTVLDILSTKSDSSGGVYAAVAVILLIVLKLQKRIKLSQCCVFVSVKSTAQSTARKVKQYMSQRGFSSRGSSRESSHVSSESSESKDDLNQDFNQDLDDPDMPTAPPVLRRSTRINGDTGMESIFSADEMRMINVRVKEILSVDKDAGFTLPTDVQ